MAATDSSHLDPIHKIDCPAKYGWVDDLDSTAVGPETAIPDDERKCDRVDTQDERPFLRDDMEEAIDTIGFNSSKHCGMDRCDCPRMAARECDQILIGFLNRTEALTQMRDRTLFERNDRGHVREDTPEAVNFLLSYWRSSTNVAKPQSFLGMRRAESPKQRRRRLSAPPPELNDLRVT
jgi:hypothetical protein